jgi:hypothetical protein
MDSNYDITVRWLPVIVPEIIDHSLQYPLVSPLYRILASLFKVVRQFEVQITPVVTVVAGVAGTPADFDGYLEQLRSDDEALLAASKAYFDTQEYRPVVNRISVFVASVKTSIGALNDELLSAALSLILQAPRIILSDIDDHVDSICLSLETGYQVELALRLLETYILRQEDKLTALVNHLPRILKLLEQYLIVPDDTEVQQKSVQFNTKLAVRLKFLSLNSANELFNIQRCVLRILGRLGGHNQLMLQPQNELLKSSLAWSLNNNSVTVKFPLLGQMTPSASRYLSQRLTQSSTQQTEIIDVKLSMDRLLPRIVEIACSQSGSTDRHAKLAAAESLHAIILLLLGSAATSPERKDRGDSDLATIYNKLLPAVISLSVDSEPMCSKLFEKLLFQIIHWFAGPQHVHDAEIAVLLDCLVDMLCTSTDTKVRNQCSNSLAEYFVWSLKQSSRKDVVSGSAATDSLLMRLFVIAVHSQSTYRSGAISVLRKIYVLFREEAALVGKYALQIVFTLLKSLQLGGSDTDFHESQEALKTYSSIILRSVRSRDDQSKLLIRNEERTSPKSVHELVDWIWTHTSHADTKLRKVCMQLFVLLSSLLVAHGKPTKAPTLANHPYINDFVTVNGIKSIATVSMGSFAAPNKSALLQLADTIGDNPGRVSPSQILFDEKLLCQIVAALDFLCWLVKNKILNPLSIVGDLNCADSPSETPVTGIRRYPFCGLFVVISACIGAYDSGSVAPIHGEDAEKNLRQLRADILLALIYFLRSCVEYFNPGDTDSINKIGVHLRGRGVWSTGVQRVLINLVLYPTLSGSLAEETAGEPNQLAHLLPPYDDNQTMNAYLPRAFQAGWKCFSALDGQSEERTQPFSAKLFQSFTEKCGEVAAHSSLDVLLVTHFCEICILLNAAKENFETLADQFSDFLNDLVCQLLGRVVTCLLDVPESPTIREAGVKIINLSCLVGLPLCPKENFIRCTDRGAQCLLRFVFHECMLAASFDQEVIDNLMCRSYEAVGEQLVRLGAEWSTIIGKPKNHSSCQAVLAVDFPESRLGEFVVKALTSLNVKLSAAVAPKDFAVEILNSFEWSSCVDMDFDLIQQLLELESHVPADNYLAVRNPLTTHIVNVCIATFQQSTASISDILRCVGMLPYLLTGCSSSSPKPISKGFTDDPVNVQNVCNYSL